MKFDDDDDDITALFGTNPTKKQAAPTTKPLAPVSSNQTAQPFGTNVGLTYIQALDADRINTGRQNVVTMLLQSPSASTIELNRPVKEGGGGSEGCKRARELRELAWGPLDVPAVRDAHDETVFHYTLKADSKEFPLTQRILDKIFQSRPDPVVDPIKLRRSRVTKLVRKMSDPLLQEVEVLLGLEAPSMMEVLQAINAEEVQADLDYLDGDDG
jgi:hypothetical protein